MSATRDTSAVYPREESASFVFSPTSGSIVEARRRNSRTAEYSDEGRDLYDHKCGHVNNYKFEQLYDYKCGHVYDYECEYFYDYESCHSYYYECGHLYDYECGQLYDNEYAADTPNVRAIFAECLITSKTHVFSVCPISPISNFSHVRVSRLSCFLGILGTPDFFGCPVVFEYHDFPSFP